MLFLSYLGGGGGCKGSSSLTSLAGGTVAVEGHFSCEVRAWSSGHVSSDFPDGDGMEVPVESTWAGQKQTQVLGLGQLPWLEKPWGG